jgi:hypothetical protein
MNKIILFLSLTFLFSNINIFAQVANYIYSDALGSYNEITGDTTVAFSTSTITNPFDLDDVTYGPNAIPFIFEFNGIDYNSFYINSNGFITIGTTPPVAANYGPIAATEVYNGAVSAFGIDLIGLFGTNADRFAGSPLLSNVVSFAGVVAGRLITGTGIAASATVVSFNQVAGTILMSAGATSTGNNEIIQIASGSIVRATTGSAGNKVHTIQFKNFRRNTTTGTVDNLNFQIKLYEATGKIEVVYGNIDEGPIPVFGQVGLRGVLHSDFNNRTTASNWLSTNSGATNDVQCMISNIVFPPAGLTLIWGPPSTTISIKVIPQGFYNLSTLKLNMRDTVTAYLRNSNFPFTIVDSADGVIDSVTFEGTFVFNNASSGEYYIVVRHRNSIETWSSLPESLLRGSSRSYDFTNAVTKAYGSNMINVNSSPVRFGIFSGDVNQDGFVDLTDLTIVFNDANNFLTGYIVTDITGNGNTDLTDLTITFNNSNSFVRVRYFDSEASIQAHPEQVQE